MNFFAVDTETTGFNFWQHDVFGMSWCSQRNKSEYELVEKVDHAKMIKIFKSDRPIVFHNAKFDLHMLRKLGYPIPKNLHDTMIMSAIYNENSKHTLENLSHKYIGVEKWKDEIKKYVKDNNCSYKEVPYKLMTKYAKRDANNTYLLSQFLYEKLQQTPKLWALYLKEMELMKQLIQIENYGVKIDTKLLTSLSIHLQDEIALYEKQIYKEAGQEFNIESDELKNILFVKLKLPVQGYTAKDHKPKTDEYALKKLMHPIIEPLLAYKLSSHMKSTYCDNIKSFLDKDDILHCSFRQHGATTGRFSCANPNLQNIPKIHRIRELFVPRVGFKWYFFDYKQMEMRLYAYFADDQKVKDWFIKGVDPYHEMAKIFYRRDDISKEGEERNFIKTFTLAKLFGLGVSGTMTKYHKTKEEAYRLNNEFKVAFPLVYKFNQHIMNIVKSKGYIESPFGRRRRLTSKTCYKGMNALIQGSGGDMMKEIMLTNGLSLVSKKSNIIVSIHDELVVEIHDSEECLVKQIVDVMEDFPQFDVKMPVDIKVTSKNWKEAVPYVLKRSC